MRANRIAIARPFGRMFQRIMARVRRARGNRSNRRQRRRETERRQRDQDQRRDDGRGDQTRRRSEERSQDRRERRREQDRDRRRRERDRRRGRDRDGDRRRRRESPNERRRRQDDDRRRRDEQRRRDRQRQKQERLRRAQRELPARIRPMLQRGARPIVLRARLAIWRVQYRLSSLSLVGGGRQRRILARVNPAGDILSAMSIDQREELLRWLRVEAERVLEQGRRQGALRQTDRALTPQEASSFQPTARQRRPAMAQDRARIRQESAQPGGARVLSVDQPTSLAGFMGGARAQTRPEGTHMFQFNQPGQAPQTSFLQTRGVQGGANRSEAFFPTAPRSQAELAAAAATGQPLAPTGLTGPRWRDVARTGGRAVRPPSPPQPRCSQVARRVPEPRACWRSWRPRHGEAQRRFR